LRCRGCWNQELWPATGGQAWNVDDLAELALANQDVEGVTISGGEPLDQAESLLLFIQKIRAAGRSVFLYTGYELNELTEIGKACFSNSDVIVTGRYIDTLRNTNLRWRGSSNQTVYFPTDRYRHIETADSNEVEIILDENGQLTVAGFPDANLLDFLQSI
jgi:anaerobic ribonucleoside-triphosphate reductase activating protein